MRAQWEKERELSKAHSPCLMPVRFRPAPERLHDHWPNIRRDPAGQDSGPLPLTGRVEDVVTEYLTITSRRLVVLGDAGAGKTCLAIEFAQRFLTERQERADRAPGHVRNRVPVVFDLSAWNPDAGGKLTAWLASRLADVYWWTKAARPDGRTLATDMIEAGLILPILDGFDEIAEGLAPDALGALDDVSMPLVLTSRPEEYEKALVARGRALAGAAVVVLDPLTRADLAAYLPRTTGTADGSRWADLLAQHADGRWDEAAATLATPLMAAMAREIYSETPGHDPSELLDYDERAELEEHLLTAYLPAAYHPARRTRRTRRWTPEKAERWLGFLACHLEEAGTRELAWWRLSEAVSLPTRGSLGFWTAGLSSALIFALVAGPVLLGPLLVSMGFLATGRAGSIGLSLTPGPAPAYAWLRARGSAGRLRAWLLAGWRRIGAKAWLPLSVLITLCLPLPIGYGLVAGALVARLSMFLFGLASTVECLEAPADLTTAVTPGALLAADRKRAVQRAAIGAGCQTAGMVVSALAFAPILGLVSRYFPSVGPVALLRVALASGLASGVWWLLSIGAWARWMLVVRCWLTMGVRRLPLRVMFFLGDAHRRGVLRQVGPHYQFRHARLQDHLARVYRSHHPAAAPTPPDG